MPKSKKMCKKEEPEVDVSDLSQDELSSVKCNSNNITTSTSSLTGKKRSYSFDIDENAGGDCGKTNDNDYDGDMSKLLENLGSDMNRALQAKKKRLELYTTGAIKANQNKVEEMWESQMKGRQHFQEELRQNVSGILDQWEIDLTRSKEQEDKMIKIINQQLKLIKATHLAQAERLATLRKIHESFYKGSQEQEEKYSMQCSNMQIELKRELQALQKKMMMKTQQEEMANMQKSLKSMLFM